MATINLDDTPQKDQNSQNSSNPASISINFTPKTPVSEVSKPVQTSPSIEPTLENKPAIDQKPQLVSMEIKKEDLSPKAEEKQTEKKGLLSGLFGQKKEEQAKPSGAWSGGLDVSKEKKMETKPAETNLEKKPAEPVKSNEKVEFFSSAALQEKSGGSKLMENIATQKAKLEQPKMEDLLGKKSTILEKTIEQESLLKMKKKLRLMQSMAFFVGMIAIAVNGYLYYQLSPGLNIFGLINYNFDSNLRNDLFNLNQSLKSVKTELNKYKYLSGQLYLNQFGYESTRFIDGIANLETSNPNTDKIQLQSVIGEAKNRMPLLLAGAKQNLTDQLVIETYQTRGEEKLDQFQTELEFQRELRLAIGKEKQSIREANSQSSLELPTSELVFFDNTLKLIGNSKLLANLNASTIEAFKLETDEYENNNEPAQRLAFRTFIDNLLASTKVNLATITNLKNSRIKWSEVMDRIDSITNRVNTEHNSGLGAGNASKISFAGFEFNSETGKITLNGISTTKSGTNREVVTYLLEALEASPEFKNVSNRSFPLSRSTAPSGEEEFSLSFKIDMEIEKGAFSKLNAPIIDLQSGEKVATVKIPVKRK